MQKIKKIIQNNLCIGCGLCESLIKDCTLEFNEFGFYEPKFKDPIEKYSGVLQDIEKICPSLNVNISNTSNNNFLWGNIESIKRGFSNDVEIRHKGSSGGVITEIARSLLEFNEIDAVLQIGAKKNYPIQNDTFSNNKFREILDCAGSRYSPATLLSNIEEELHKNERFLIIGKPCDITAVKNYLNLKRGFENRVIYTLSFFCAGTPSQNATNQLVKDLGVNDGFSVTKFNYRGGGWPGEVQIQTKEGFKNNCSYEDSWGKLLGKNLNKRCKLCPDGIGLEADIVCADAWESSDGYPDFLDKPGYSLVIARSKTGNEVLNILLNKNRITLEEVDIENLKQMQPYQWHRIVFVISRLLGARLRGYRFNFKGLNFRKKFFLGSLRLHVSNFRGVLRRF